MASMAFCDMVECFKVGRNDLGAYNSDMHESASILEDSSENHHRTLHWNLGLKPFLSNLCKCLNIIKLQGFANRFRQLYHQVFGDRKID